MFDFVGPTLDPSVVPCKSDMILQSTTNSITVGGVVGGTR